MKDGRRLGWITLGEFNVEREGWQMREKMPIRTCVDRDIHPITVSIDAVFTRLQGRRWGWKWWEMLEENKDGCGGHNGKVKGSFERRGRIDFDFGEDGLNGG
jgi:hypothetical protein